MSLVNVYTGYTARAAFDAFHEREQRWAVLVVHRRGGKTVACINDLVERALVSTKEQPRFAYIAPFRVQAKAVAWDYLKRYTAMIPGVRVNESELRVDLPNGARVTLYGADNYDALRGIYLDGVVLDEFGDMDPDAFYSVVFPALTDRLGWAVFIGTPKGRNAFFRLYDKARLDVQYYTLFLPASQSGVLPQSELERASVTMGEQAFNREYECDFTAAIDDAIYGPQVNRARGENRIRDFNPDQSVPAFTFWDIGQSDFTAIWVIQLVGRDICVYDYFCRSHEVPAFYATKVKDWERDLGVRVAGNYVPHDAASLGPSGKTYVSYLKEAGLRDIKVVPRTPDVWLGINELRALFPRLFIHQTNCGKGWTLAERQFPSGLDCLEYYHTKEENDNGTISENPVHDESSHGASALRTFAEALPAWG